MIKHNNKQRWPKTVFTLTAYYLSIKAWKVNTWEACILQIIVYKYFDSVEAKDTKK